MTAPAGTTRASRSRILVVGDPAVVTGFEFDSRSIEVVADMFAAIGEIAASSASAPIEMIVVDDGAVGHPLEVIADSIHRLDPGVLVYLSVRNDADGGMRSRALAARFDGVLEASRSAEIHPRSPDDSAAQAAHPSIAVGPDHAEHRDRDDTADAIAVDREFETARDDAAESNMRCAASRPAIPAALAAPISAAERAGPLGDIDIVEAILDDPARGIETALALIAQETGWRGVQFLPASGPGDGVAPQDSAPVILRSVTHGHLSAEGVSRASLESWASWLARWAALASAQRELWHMARCDALTGAWNRRYFDECLPRVLEEARQKRRQIPLMVFDVDNLKLFNDRHGHEAGDTVLRETVRLLQSIIRKGDQVFRIGGDEFVVVFADPDPPRKPGSGVIESVETIARRFQTEICLMKFPKLGPDAPGTLSISAGLATYPWDGADADTLLRVADQLALDSKRGGKNALTIGPGAAARCHPDSSSDAPS